MSSFSEQDEQYIGGYAYGSFKGDGDYPPDGDDEGLDDVYDEKPRVLLMGLRRSGKSSIQQVVFHKMSPNETLFLESTNKICKDDIANTSFVQFSIWDFPGQVDFFDSTFDSEMIFGGSGALIFVIDSQDDYIEALNRLHQTVTQAYKVNPRIKFEVFIHKVDGLSDDHKIETQRDIHQRAREDLVEAGLEEQINLNFHLTSIYDHSIFEAFSKVVQKLIPQLPTLENLLNIIISKSGIEKAYLFDVVSKIYIATDSSPVDMQSYELCCDMIDVVIDISCIYGVYPKPPEPRVEAASIRNQGVLLYCPKNRAIAAMQDEQEAAAFDSQSSSIIKLHNQTVLYLRQVNQFLALVCILREDNFERQDYEDDSSSASESDVEWEKPSSRPKMTMYADVEEQRQRIHAERDFRNRLNRTPWEHMLNDYTPPPPMPSTERWKHDKWEEIMDESGNRSRSPVSVRYPPSLYRDYRPVYDKESYYRTREKFLPPISIPGCPPGLPSSSGKADLLRGGMYGELKKGPNESDKAAPLPEFQKDKARLGSVVISVDAKENAAGREVRIVKKGEEPNIEHGMYHEVEGKSGEAATRHRESVEEETQRDGDCPPGMRGSTWSYSTLPKSKRQSKQKSVVLKSVVREEGEISSESEEEVE